MEMEPLVKLRLIVVFCIGFILMCSSESYLIIQQHRAVAGEALPRSHAKFSNKDRGTNKRERERDRER